MNGVVSSNSFASFRVFLYLGIGLVVLAVATFPMKIPIQAQPGDVDYFIIGWLFAPIIGIWGLASIVLGLVQSSMPKRRIESYLLPLLVMVSVGLAYAAYLVIVFGTGVIRSVGKGEPFFWLYFSLVLAPSLLIYSLTAKFLKSDERRDILSNKRVRAVAFVVLAAVPLSYTAGFFLMMYLL